MPPATTCPSCSAPLDADRCTSCGAAVRVRSYRVLSVLAASAHGRTYRAEGPSGVVALKELVFALVPSAQQLDAFEREAKLLASVSHPQVPRMVESFQDGEGPALRLYLAQELVEGEPLSARLGMDEAEARDVARQLLRVLEYLHERGIVHRDVKPANVLRRAGGSLALVDFGAARVVEGVAHDATVVGTFGYMPPEQLGGTVDATSDLYAVGATLVHLVGRKAPDEILGPDLELRLDHLRVTPAFRAFLARLTARRRASRPPSGAEALRLLDSPGPSAKRVVGTRVVVAAALAAFAALALAVQPLLKSSRDAHERERARRAQLETIRRDMEAPPKPVPPPPPPKTDRRDISLGRLLQGSRLREIDPELPACYGQAGVELARLSVWPAQNAIQLKVVLHSRDQSCDWFPLQIAASTDDDAALHARGAHGDAPRDGWREAYYDFDLPPGAGSISLKLSGPTRSIEAWRVGLVGSGIRRTGYALAAPTERLTASFEVPRASGCATLQSGRIDSIWIDDTAPEQRQLRVRATFATRKDAAAPCQSPARLALVDATRSTGSEAQLDRDGSAVFSLPVPRRDRLRVALGSRRRPAAVFRIDLEGATAEQEPLAAVVP